MDEGVPVAEIAARPRVSAGSVYRWRRRWSAGGREALASKGTSGSTCRLDEAQLQQLAAALDEGPTAHGFGPDQRWPLARITELIERLFHVTYTLRGTSYLLQRLGFAPQIPAQRATERDPDAIAAWRSRRWLSVRG
ncbi:winged helix-turn-helix domain-containing protein [Dactylosporangium sp. NPDC049525]|uniref:winged helix-turn-helix domain-containing protein n=1 Tax=Dactylosporangium sp. NPDC049525 TaxID=3154730 RepID=UPI00343AAB5D